VWLPSASEWVGQGSTRGIDDRGRPEIDASAAEGDIPGLVVDSVVVGRAQQTTILHRSLAAVDPMPRVVGFTQPAYAPPGPIDRRPREGRRSTTRVTASRAVPQSRIASGTPSESAKKCPTVQGR